MASARESGVFTASSRNPYTRVRCIPTQANFPQIGIPHPGRWLSALVAYQPRKQDSFEIERSLPERNPTLSPQIELTVVSSPRRTLSPPYHSLEGTNMRTAFLALLAALTLASSAPTAFAAAEAPPTTAKSAEESDLKLDGVVVVENNTRKLVLIGIAALAVALTGVLAARWAKSGTSEAPPSA